MTEPEVLKGAEPCSAKGNRTGVLVSHGYTGSPQSMRYLAESLAQAGFSGIHLDPSGTPTELQGNTRGDRTTSPSCD
jgi:carboxylesterase